MAAAAAAIGVSVLIGWGADLPSLRSVLPGAVEMKPNTAVGLLFAGLALLFYHLPYHPVRRSGALVLAGLVTLIGLATSAEYLFNWQLGIDELLFLDTGDKFAPPSRRMSPFSAAAFSAAGIALFTLSNPTFRRLARFAAVLVAALGALTLLGSLWNASELTTELSFPPVALNAAIAFLLLGVGLVTSRGGELPTESDDDFGQAIRAPMITAFLGATTLILVLGGYAYRNGAEASDAADRVVHTQMVRRTIGLVRGSLADAVTTQRGYMLTGDTAFRREFQTASNLAMHHQETLQTLVSDNPTQLLSAAALDSLGKQRIALLERHLTLYEEVGRDSVMDLILAEGGVSIMRAVRGLADSMDRVEERLLRSRNEAALDSRQRTFITLLVVLAVSLGGATLAFRTIRKAILRQRNAEAALRDNEHHLDVTLRSIGDAVLATDLTGRIVRLNPVAEALTGWTQEEAFGQPAIAVLQLIDAQDRRPAYLPIADTLTTGETHALADHTILVARDGSECYIADSCAPIRDEDGAVSGAVLVFRDVSEEYRSREALAASETRLRTLNSNLEQEVDARVRDLRVSEQRFASLFESAPDAVVVTDECGVIHLVNQQGSVLFGWTREALIDVRIQDLLPGAMDGEFLPETFPADQRVTARRQGGIEFPVELRLSPPETSNGRLRIISIRDVTDRDQLETQLRQSQRMDTVGRLAGGIAHDFNNLITIVNATAELAITSLPVGDPMREEFDAIRSAGEKAAALTRQLLAFGRKQVLHPTLLDVSDVVQRLEPMFRRLIGAHISIDLALGTDPAVVMMDEGQLEQIIMNLVINSRDAMPGGGTLTVETTRVHLDASYARTHPGVEPGEYVRLSVTDTGIGMDAATRQRIFEPFFTTKELGRGTGLGMATVYGIVKQSGGDIWIYSELGKGTVSKIYLPYVPETVSAPEASAAAAVVGGKELVLLVDDEAALRHVGRRILESAGYEVAVAAEGREALTMLNKGIGNVRLVITDVVMPGMGGRELAVELRRLHPDTAVLFTSGYTEDLIHTHGVVGQGIHFISKPYTIDELLRKVRAVIDA